jgi:hypothetical protein
LCPLSVLRAFGLFTEFRRSKLIPKANPPAMQNIKVTGTGNTINLTQGDYAKLNSKFSPRMQWYQNEMSKHGLSYWSMHALIALIVVAVWEYRHWFFGLFK